MRILSLLAILVLTTTVDAQIFRRSKCQSGNCQSSPEIEKSAVIGQLPTGVDSEQLEKGYRINDQKVERHNIVQALENTIPEMNKKWRAVIVGNTEDRTAVINKIGDREGVAVNAYPPDHWYVKDFRGSLLTLMKPTGEVVAEAKTVAQVDEVMENTKIAPDLWKPKQPDPKLPDPKNPDPKNPDSLINGNHVAGGVGGILLTLFFTYIFPLLKKFLFSSSKATIEAAVAKALADMAAKENSKG